MYKYTAELHPSYDSSPNYTLRVRVESGSQYYTAEAVIGPRELHLESIFDVVFRDLKENLKRYIREEGAPAWERQS